MPDNYYYDDGDDNCNELDLKTKNFLAWVPIVLIAAIFIYYNSDAQKNRRFLKKGELAYQKTYYQGIFPLIDLKIQEANMSLHEEYIQSFSFYDNKLKELKPYLKPISKIEVKKRWVESVKELRIAYNKEVAITYNLFVDQRNEALAVQRKIWAYKRDTLNTNLQKQLFESLENFILSQDELTERLSIKSNLLEAYGKLIQYTYSTLLNGKTPYEGKIEEFSEEVQKYKEMYASYKYPFPKKKPTTALQKIYNLDLQNKEIRKEIIKEFLKNNGINAEKIIFVAIE